MRRLLLAIALLASLAVYAGVTVTRAPGKWELRDAEGVPVKQGGVNVRTDTLEQCETAAVRAFGPTALSTLAYRCVTAVTLTVTGSCDELNTVPEPPHPVDDDGYTVLQEAPEPLLCPDGVNFELRQRVWTVTYPKCGEYRDTVYQACGHVVTDELEHVTGDLLMEPHPELVGTD